MAKRKKEVFDVEQGHGNHLACLHNFSETMEFIDRWLELSFETATIIAQSSAPISCNLSEDFDGKATGLWQISQGTMPPCSATSRLKKLARPGMRWGFRCFMA